MSQDSAATRPNIFVNLPIRDLPRSRVFFEKLGFQFDPRFTDDKAACMIVGNGAHVMLLTRSFFATFTDRPLADPERTVSGLYALALASRAQVDALAVRAEAAGGQVLESKDMGFMYQRSFVDLDGYQWEPFCMDEGAFEEAQKGSS